MRNYLKPALAGCLLSVLAFSAAMASESPAQAVGSVVDFKSANDRSIALSTAIANETVRHGGFTNRNYINNTTNIGTSNSWAYHYGPETSTNAVTELNSSSTDVTATVGSNVSGVVITANAPTTQISGTADQSTTAKSVVKSN